MAISSYEQGDVTFWKVYVNLRSKIDPKIREQKVIVELPSELAAKSEEKKLIKDLSVKIATREGFGRQWREVIDTWEEEIIADGYKRLSQVALMDGVSMLKRQTAAWLDRPASEITRADARKVLDAVEADGMSQPYVQRVKCLIGTVFDWGMEREFIRGVKQSPVADMAIRKRKEEKLPEILSLDEIKKLLWAGKKLDHEWLPAWSVALFTGMRNGELHSLLWSDIDLEQRLISVNKSYNTRSRKVKSTKSGRWRSVPISPELYQVLADLKASAGDRKHVLPRFWQWDKGQQAAILRAFCKAIGIRSVKFHTLRACFATQLLSGGISPARVMKICGWADLKTMQRYIRFSGMDEKGATDGLVFLVSDQEALGLVGKVFELRPDPIKEGVQFSGHSPEAPLHDLAKAG